MQLHNRARQRINTDFVGGRKQRFRIKSFIKEQMRRAIERNPEVVFRSPEFVEGVCDFARKGVFFGFLERWNVQTAVCPDSAAHSRAPHPGYNLERLEPENQRRDYLSAFSGENGNGYDFINCFSDGILIRDVSDLLDFRQFLERQLRFGL